MIGPGSLLRVMLPLPPGEFRAYLFDCDGTVADSMPLHYRAWSQAVGEWGCDFPEDLFYAWGGRTVPDIIADLNSTRGLAMPPAEVDERREGLYQELLPQLTAVPEVLAHIEHAHGRVPFAVVSGGARASVARSLTTLGLLDRFDLMVCAEDYTRAKPDPEAFLLAAQRLGVAPEHCVVFEDTDLGVAAATAAGMAWVRVPPPWQRAAA
ncbi:phosphatase [Catellatospora methionotrophica]|uniref:Phosphatase n=1 Tax=Catellatospora methionotrophica TaxID=121620 RepID=A0A8J3PJ20_9ACTN|nr:HAD-IA family hydrolase [Catellatospora methionotrophica]GIG19007.1 phosphatase [Catellatospora methionotrophica]